MLVNLRFSLFSCKKQWKFTRPQADFVRGRDYSFVTSDDGQKLLSLNTLKKRMKVTFDLPKTFEEYFDGTWSFGSGKIVSMNGNWYFHIPMTKSVSEEFSKDHVNHVVGIDRGIRFLVTCYDEKGKVTFVSGKEIQENSVGYILAEEKNGRCQSPGDVSAVSCTWGREQKRSLGASIG